MNSLSLIKLHEETYPKSHITSSRLNPVIYELMYLTEKVDEPLRKVLVKGTLLEMVSQNYKIKEDVDNLRNQIDSTFDKVYDNECCISFLWLCT